MLVLLATICITPKVYSQNIDSFHKVLAYYTSTEESYTSLQAYSDYLDMLSIDVFNVQDDGTIVQYDLGAADYAFAHGEYDSSVKKLGKLRRKH